MPECPFCESEYDSEHGLNSHVGHMHAEESRVEANCEYCGSDLSLKSSEVQDKNFCGQECYSAWQSENRVAEDAPQYKGDKPSVECVVCGTDFTVSHYRENTAKFCSRDCMGRRKEVTKSGDNSNFYKGGKVTVKCEWCGEAFNDHPSNLEGKEHHFCSNDCYGRWRSENIHGENHPQYEGGKRTRRYGSGWNEAKKRAVRERDDHRCQACGMHQDDHIEEYGRKLSVHHITPARQFDDAQRRNRMDNLLTLCTQCHSRWEGIPLRPQ